MRNPMQFLLPATIGYGCKGEGCCFRFLNTTVLTLPNGCPRFLPYNANATFALGQAHRQTVARIRPKLGGIGWSSGQLRQYVRQKLAVHRQIVHPQVPAADCYLEEADRLMVGELRRLGYSDRALLARWEELPPMLNDRAVHRIRAELRACCRQRRAAAAPLGSRTSTS